MVERCTDLASEWLVHAKDDTEEVKDLCERMATDVGIYQQEMLHLQILLPQASQPCHRAALSDATPTELLAGFMLEKRLAEALGLAPFLQEMRDLEERLKAAMELLDAHQPQPVKVRMAGLKQSAITDEEWDIQSYTTYTPTSSEFVLRLTCITSFVEVESLTPDRAQGEFSLQRSFADTGSSRCESRRHPSGCFNGAQWSLAFDGLHSRAAWEIQSIAPASSVYFDCCCDVCPTLWRSTTASSQPLLQTEWMDSKAEALNMTEMMEAFFDQGESHIAPTTSLPVLTFRLGHVVAAIAALRKGQGRG
eukprot:g30754.t1